jgi:hypothetical protein
VPPGKRGLPFRPDATRWPWTMLAGIMLRSIGSLDCVLVCSKAQPRKARLRQDLLDHLARLHACELEVEACSAE